MDETNVSITFCPPPRQDWHYVAYLVGWIVDLTRNAELEAEVKDLIERKLAFLLNLPTVLERRNESTRRILRVLMDPTLPPPPLNEQGGGYWVDILSDDRASGTASSIRKDKDQELLDLCRQFGEVGI